MENTIIIKNVKEKEAIKVYLTREGQVKEKKFKSSYLAALIHARELTGRNIETGVIENEKQTGSWAGACMYLILIDHIGGLFRDKNKPIDNNLGDIKAALKSFTELCKKDIDILKQLRNSFLHKFNLFDFPKDPRYKKRLFSVDRSNILITYPKKEIDCEIYEIKEDNQLEYTTSISLKKIGDLVEEIHKRLLALLEDDSLLLILKENKSLKEFLGLNIIIY